jgi:phage shock protein PspC (stress-responsive transcriptional regulator)
MSADSGIGDSHAEQTKAESAEPVFPARQSRKLYRLRNDRMVEGICAGIGAYLGVDPTIVRVIAVVLLILSGGTAAAIYLVLVVVIPEAKTPEQHAAAHGAPFNAKEVLERARVNLQGLHEASEQRQQQRRQPAYWHRHGDRHKGCLGAVLTLVAFIVGVSLLMKWLRWPFRSAVIQNTLVTPYEPWGQAAILAVLIVGLGALVRKLARSGGAGTLLFTILNFCLVILVLMLVVYLSPLALAGIVNLWSWLIGLF